MKFRKWKAEDYFVQISQQILALANDEYARHPKQLSGKVEVEPNWALFNWVVEYENLIYWSKVDKDYASPSEQKNKPAPVSNLELPSKLIPLIPMLKNNPNALQQFSKCLVYMLNNLSTSELYALQFLIRMIKLNQFFKNMKAFAEMCAKFESQFDYFGTVNGVSSGYGTIFLERNQPELKKIKQEVTQILQAYEVEQMIVQKNSKFYDIELCIKLIRGEIYNEKVKIEEKDQNFNFMAENAGIETILAKIKNIRDKDNESTIVRKDTVKVLEVIKRNAKLFDKATQIVQNHPSFKEEHKERNRLKITEPMLQINSENSNSIIEEETKRIFSNERIYEKLTFSKLYQLSNHLEDDEVDDQILANDQKNILQILEDQKTIRHDFTSNVAEVKKEKKIKKIRRQPKIIGFNCVNGKISISEDDSLQNESLSIKDSYIQQRMRILQERKRKEQLFVSSQDSILEEAEESSLYLKVQKKEDSFEDIELEGNRKVVKGNSEECEPNQKSTEESLFATPVKQSRLNYFVNRSLSLKDDGNENLNLCNHSQAEVKMVAVPINPESQHKNVRNHETTNNPASKAAQSGSVQKASNYKESYKLANSRFAPLSKSIVPSNRFNSKVNFIRRSKNEVRHSRTNLQASTIQMAFYKKLHEPRYDPRFSNFQDNDDQYVVDDTPPKYKKMKSVNE